MYHFCVGFELESCSGAEAMGTPRGPRGLRGGGYGAYGESAVSGTELHRVTVGWGHAANWRKVMLCEDSNSESAASVWSLWCLSASAALQLIMH